MLPYIEAWYSALKSPYGIAIKTNDPGRLRSKLYEARQKTMDEDLLQLSVHWSPRSKEEIWIVKMRVKEVAA